MVTAASVDDIASGRVRTQLARFLAFVVEEALAGRWERLKGRVIGQEVFERGKDFDPQSDTIVRVEAGRLRRRLHHYYATKGKDDPIRIDVPKGSYLPTFEWAPQEVDIAATPALASTIAPSHPPRLRRPLIAAVVGLLVLGGAGLWFLLPSDPTPRHDEGQRFSSNPEAYALYLETRMLGRPPSNRERVEAALDLAREVVRLDPDFAGGYAIESFFLWGYIVLGHSEAPEEDAARALELAEKAVALQPEFGAGHQSLSRGRHLVGDLNGAVVAARQAVDLQPNVAEFHGNLGLVLTFAGQPEAATAPLRDAIRLAGNNPRAPFWNYLGIAYFHAGRYEDAIEVLETNRERGGPSGPHMYVYEAAAHAELEQYAKAHAAAERVRAAPTAFSVEDWIERLFRDAATRRRLLSALELAGLDRTTL